jgi:peptidyl-prolyl cis-trans isomerase B (cyclophilin B)
VLRRAVVHAGVVASLSLLATACASDDAQDIPDNQQPIPTADAVITQPPPPTTAAVGADLAGCEVVETPAPKPDGGHTAPSETLDPELTWTLTFETSCGVFVVTLDLESAPQTTASLVALAEAGYFDETLIHRIVPGVLFQGGDPTGGTGSGPGYRTVDVPASDARYLRGVVGMAKTSAEAPGTAGSQYFVAAGADLNLPPEYAIVGQVTEGMEVVDRISALGDAAEQPTAVVVVHTVTVAST